MLAESPHLANLTSLNLENNDIDDAGAQALAASPYLQKLTRLDLMNAGIGDTGAQALATSPHLQHLASLNLEDNSIGPVGLAAFAEGNFKPEMRIAVNGISGSFADFKDWHRAQALVRRVYRSGPNDTLPPR